MRDIHKARALISRPCNGRSKGRAHPRHALRHRHQRDGGCLVRFGVQGGVCVERVPDHQHGAGARERGVYDVSLERVARAVGQQFEAGSSVPIGDVIKSF